MSVNEQSNLNQQIVRTTRIIVLALCMGVTTFTIVIVAMVYSRPAPQGNPVAKPEATLLLPFLAIPFAMGAGAGAFLLPRVLDKQTRQALISGKWKTESEGNPRSRMPRAATEDAFLANAYQTRLIVRSALCEGAAFFALVMFLISQAVWLLGIPLLMLMFILSFFPSVDRLLSWIDEQKSLMLEARQFGL